MSNATCPVQHVCSHCKLPFHTAEAKRAHLERSGHGAAASPSPHTPEPRRCACSMVLVAPVSVDANACSACRWEARRVLDAAALRMLAGSFRAKARRLQEEGNEGWAQDYFSEARALEDEAQEREAANG